MLRGKTWHMYTPSVRIKKVYIHKKFRRNSLSKSTNHSDLTVT